jgi:hypothetical protein
MSWNYRVMKKRIKGEDVFEIHEVYYHPDGRIHTWSEDPVILYGETPEELKQDILRQSRALERPVLDYDTLTPDQDDPR